MKKLLYLFSFVATILLTTSCEEKEPEREFPVDAQDEQGNLLINNNSGERLALYVNEYLIKHVPSTATDYKVYIETTDGATVELDIYLWSDIKEDPNNPDPGKVWKKWIVPLSTSTSADKRATWSINSEDPYTTVATLKLAYNPMPNDGHYNVDVYANGRKGVGSKLASLSPGSGYMKVGVEYGLHTLHYLYWTSNQNDNQGVTEIGWRDSYEYQGIEIPFQLVLNLANKQVTKRVDGFGKELEFEDNYGRIDITNNSEVAIEISADGGIIEDICVIEGEESAEGYSLIPKGKTQTYYLPINNNETGEQVYSLSARFFGINASDATNTVTIKKSETNTWVIDMPNVSMP